MSRRVTDEEREAWEEEVGARRRTPKPPPKKENHSVAAPPRKKLAAPPAPLNPLPGPQAKKQFAARVEAKIDLHGMTQPQAHDALFGFIVRCHAAGKRHVVVITGKGSRGEGVLKRTVPHWLELPQLRRHISAIGYASPEKGGDGVLHVLLKKPS